MKRSLAVASTCLGVALLAFAASYATASGGAPASAPVSASAPLVCSQGPSNQRFTVLLTVPHDVAPESTYTVRIDGVSSGSIEHFGLNYIHDIETDYVLPQDAKYVAGSARIVPETGTPNVAASARVTSDGRALRVVLPGRVAAGTTYTPPSIEFRLVAPSTPGASLPIALSEYRVTANAFMVGDVRALCQPAPKPYPLGASRVTPVTVAR